MHHAAPTAPRTNAGKSAASLRAFAHETFAMHHKAIIKYLILLLLLSSCLAYAHAV